MWEEDQVFSPPDTQKQEMFRGHRAECPASLSQMWPLGEVRGKESWSPPLLTCLQGFQGPVHVVPTRPIVWVPGKRKIPLHTPGQAP